jgi:hypothetical protein
MRWKKQWVVKREAQEQTRAHPNAPFGLIPPEVHAGVKLIEALLLI